MTKVLSPPLHCINELFILEYHGEPVVGQYFVEGWSKNITNMQGSSTMQVLRISVQFRQKFLSIFMVTYLPTILMNIINQATNYLSGESKYDLVITVNITSMMVLASIYLSVSTSLPSTPNIKPVESWLLTNLAYPFLVILVNIALQASASILLYYSSVPVKLLCFLETCGAGGLQCCQEIQQMGC